MSPDLTALLIFLAIGLVAGWLASLVLGGGGLVRNLIVGVIGAFVGGWLLSAAGVSLPIENTLLSQVITATIGAIVVILVARIIARCQELPGQELFQYVDEDGEVRDVTSEAVNDYIREASGGPFTAKDFRTWAGTVLAYRALRALDAPEDAPDKGRVVAAIKVTADRLGNTPAVARGSYVHPAVLQAYLDGSLGGALVEWAEEEHDPPMRADRGEELEVVRLLRQRRADEAAELRRRAVGRRRGGR